MSMVLNPFDPPIIVAYFKEHRRLLGEQLAEAVFSKTEEGRALKKVEVVELTRKESLQKHGTELPEFISLRADAYLEQYYDDIDTNISGLKSTLSRIDSSLSAMEAQDYAAVASHFQSDAETYKMLRDFKRHDTSHASADFDFVAYFSRCIAFCEAMAEEYRARDKRKK